MAVEDLHRQILVCRKCPLHQTRTLAVPGEGDPQAKVVFIGEGPGHWEDVQGRPFVGRAGKLLDLMLGEIGLKREQVFITNIVKCRPPENRRPTPEETVACAPYLQQQLEAINPKVLVPLGNTAGEWVFQKYGLKWPKITQANARVFKVSTLFGTLNVVPAFHPAAILRNPPQMGELRAAFKKISDLI
ncbi:MAG TPA: uracil-DNA glycosylase [archaeon]|nr:uracil-DNA glycosylase [archaeon]